MATAGASSSKSKIDSSGSKKKVIETSIKNSASGSKNRSVSKTTTLTQSKTVTKTREKKVFSLPGQKFDVPEEREPLRIFYESLSKQIPSSEMAEFWLMEHGMLSPERAKRAFEKKQRKQKQIRMGTPIKSPPRPITTSRSSSSGSKPEISRRPQKQQVPNNGEVKAQKRKLKSDSDDDDDDFVLSHKRRKG